MLERCAFDRRLDAVSLVPKQACRYGPSGCHAAGPKCWVDLLARVTLQPKLSNGVGWPAHPGECLHPFAGGASKRRNRVTSILNSQRAITGDTAAAKSGSAIKELPRLKKPGGRSGLDGKPGKSNS
jgi:hypothetical protein